MNSLGLYGRVYCIDKNWHEHNRKCCNQKFCWDIIFKSSESNFRIQAEMARCLVKQMIIIQNNNNNRCLYVSVDTLYMCANPSNYTILIFKWADEEKERQREWLTICLICVFAVYICENVKCDTIYVDFAHLSFILKIDWIFLSQTTSYRLSKSFHPHNIF